MPDQVIQRAGFCACGQPGVLALAPWKCKFGFSAEPKRCTSVTTPVWPVARVRPAWFTNDAYADGAFVGAAIGLVSADCRLLWLRRAVSGRKIEGLRISGIERRVQLLRATVQLTRCNTD